MFYLHAFCGKGSWLKKITPASQTVSELGSHSQPPTATQDTLWVASLEDGDMKKGPSETLDWPGFFLYSQFTVC